MPQVETLTKAVKRATCHVMENTNPFPEDAFRQTRLFFWTVASAIALATSPCTLLHRHPHADLYLAAIPCRPDELRRHSGRPLNLLMLLVGDLGAGKSVALWLDVQVFSYYDQKWEARAEAMYDRLIH